MTVTGNGDNPMYFLFKNGGYSSQLMLVYQSPLVIIESFLSQRAPSFVRLFTIQKFPERKGVGKESPSGFLLGETVTTSGAKLTVELGGVTSQLFYLVVEPPIRKIFVNMGIFPKFRG